MPLVSRAFSEACRDPCTWPELSLTYSDLSTEAHWLSILRWLAVRASGLQTLVCRDIFMEAPVRVPSTPPCVPRKVL